MVVVQGLSENCADILCSLCEPEFWNGRHLCRRDFQGFSVTDVLILWRPALRMVIVPRVFAGASDVWPTEMRHLLTTSGITEFLEASIALVYGLIRQLGKHRILLAQISSLREALARVTGSHAHAPVFYHQLCSVTSANSCPRREQTLLVFALLTSQSGCVGLLFLVRAP